jgi:hypothetical protein
VGPRPSLDTPLTTMTSSGRETQNLQLALGCRYVKTDPSATDLEIGW